MDLSVQYMGLNLKSPIIVGSSGLTNSFDKIKEFEKNGAGAVVLKSLFEEQILFEAEQAGKNNAYDYPEALDYIKTYAKEESLTQYLDLIKACKQGLSIPVIASINCASEGEWLNFAKKIEEAGADALEVNISLLPTDLEKSAQDYEKMYFEIVEHISSVIKIPLALKMSHYSAGLANLIRTLSWTKKVNAFVLFNRYYNPDINIDTMKISSSGVFSSSSDLAASLRWVAVLSDQINAQISASTGVRSGKDVVKQLLAGANTVQVVSALYKEGAPFIATMLEEIKEWMNQKGYSKIDDFRGLLNYKNAHNPIAFDRVQFMKYFAGIE